MPDLPDSDSSYDLAPKSPETPPSQPVESPAPRPARSPKTSRTPRAPAAPIPLAPLTPSAPAPAPATQPWTCILCGFHADAKPRRGTCPECGAPADPRGTGLLQYCTPAWIHYLATGTLVLFAGVLLHVTAVIVAHGWDKPRPGIVLQVLASALQLAGIWILTTREPHPQAAHSSLAFPARLSALVALLLFAAMALQIFRNPDVFPTPMAALVLLATAAVAFLVGFDLRHLALRIPADAIAAHALNLAWITAAACLFLAAALFTGLARLVYDIPGKLFMFTVPMLGILFALVIWAQWILLRLFLNLRDCALAAAAPPRKRPAPKSPATP